MTNSYLTDTRPLDRPVETPAATGPDSGNTRRIYDLVAPLYSVSTRLFHSRAHREALATSGIQNGMRTLEVAMGSGQMFQRLVRLNPSGSTLGVDLSPNMAARSQDLARRRFPQASAFCQSADARSLPYPTNYFNAIMCCYLFELLPDHHAGSTMAELTRVLRPGGNLTIVLVAQNKRSFNAIYRLCTKVAPAFWGRQVEKHVSALLTSHGFQINQDRYVRQLFYSSRIISATSTTK